MYKQNDAIRKLLRVDVWHKAGYTGKNIKIVVLDSNAGKPRKFQKDYLIDVFGKSTNSGHGSNVAQVIHEFAPDARIYYFDITRNKDEVFAWIDAHKHEIDFINVSMAGIAGMTTPDYLRYEQLRIPMFCASGNDGYTDRISYPARYDFSIAVGATNSKGQHVSGYSNKGPSLDIVSTSNVYIMNDSGDMWAPSGTSFADPTAVGTMALYEQWRRENGMPKITPEDVMDYVDNPGSCIDMYTPGRDDKSGYGLLVLPEKIPTVTKSPDPVVPPTLPEEKPKEVPTVPKIIKRAVVNYGHGPKNNGTYDSGAVGPTKYPESLQNKEVGEKVVRNLRFNGWEILPIQDGDLWDVTNQANDWKPAYFLSLHQNSFDSNSRGIETIISGRGGVAEKIANSIQSKLVKATGLADRGVKVQNLHVLVQTIGYPSVLVESGFISNPAEEALMRLDSFDEVVAEAICEGFSEALGVPYIKYPSPKIGGDNVKHAVLCYSFLDLGAGLLVSQKFGSCAIYFRSNDAQKTFNPDAMKAEILHTVGGPKVGHPKEDWLSGNTAKDTMQAVVNIL